MNRFFKILGLSFTVGIIGIVIAFGIYLIFFKPGAYAIITSTAQDYVWSIEFRKNDTASLWLRNSELGSYCTADPALIKKMHDIADSMKKKEVFLYFTYRSINNGDPEQTYVGVGDGCANEKVGMVYKLVELDDVTSN